MSFSRLNFWSVCGLAAGLATGAHAGSNAYVNDFLQMGFGARAMALGGASFVAVADDSSAIYWNPAGLTQVRRSEVNAMYRQRFANVYKDQEYDLVVPRRNSAFALSYFQTTIGDVPVIRSLSPSEESSFVTGTGSLPTGSASSARDSAAFFSWAAKPYDHLSLGVTGKLINRNFLDSLHAWGYGLDGGLLYRAGPWGAGLNIQDALQYLKWKGTDPNTNESLAYSENGPLGVLMGVSYHCALSEGGNTLVTSLAGERVGSGFWPRLGLELSYGFIQFQGGMLYNGASSESDSGFKSSYTFQPSMGLGIEIKSLSFQYALRFHPLGMIQSLSMTYKWGINPNDINLALPRHPLVYRKELPDSMEYQQLMALLEENEGPQYSRKGGD